MNAMFKRFVVNMIDIMNIKLYILKEKMNIKINAISKPSLFDPFNNIISFDNIVSQIISQ